MSLEFLEDLEQLVDAGKDVFAVPGPHVNQWFLSEDVEELQPKAQRTANARKYAVNIFRLVNKMDTVSEDSYLVVRKILDPGPRGDPNLQWSQVDTREAADMMRDVSQGPTPYFGAVVEETFEPK